MTLELNYRATKDRLARAQEEIEYLESEIVDLRKDAEHWKNAYDARLNIISMLRVERDRLIESQNAAEQNALLNSQKLVDMHSEREEFIEILQEIVSFLGKDGGFYKARKLLDRIGRGV